MANELYKRGQFELAEVVLLQEIKIDPASERAWLLLVNCTQSIDQKIQCLRKIIEINPSNTSAKQRLDNLEDMRNHADEQETGSSKKKKKDKGMNSESLPSQGTNEENEKSQKSPQVKYQDPKRVKRTPEDDFFYGFQDDDDLFIPREAEVTVNFVKINGIGFSLFDGPPCVQHNSSQANNQCDFCDFFTPQDCLLRYDEFLLEYIQRYADIRSKRLEATQRNKQEIHQTIHKELKAHGRPLHYTIIASMITDRYPEFKLNARSVHRILQWHPELFTRVEVGVYQAK